MTDGILVAVEGIDRSGKTTLVGAVADVLRSNGLRVSTRTEPSVGVVGVFFRHLCAGTSLPAAAAALLSAADRHEQQTTLATDLAAGDVVLSDRYYLSGLAYHHADGIDPGFYRSLNEGIRRPDLYLYLTLAPELAATRGEPPAGRWEQPELTARLPASYRTAIHLLTRTESAQVVHVDASRPPDLVLNDALHAISAAHRERNPLP